MPELASLPAELLRLIISQLRPFEIERLARTFNKRLYDVSLPLLAQRIAAKRHAGRMIARFGPKVDFEWGPQNLDTLGLNSDLYWLQPHTSEEVDEHRDFDVDQDNESRVDDLVVTTKRLGLTLPIGFVRFMRSQEMQFCIPSLFDEFYLGNGGLRKCPAIIDGGAGGYIIRFLLDELHLYSWNLYLDPNGDGHCILGDSEEANLPTDPNSGYFREMIQAGHVTEDEIKKGKEEGFEMATTSANTALWATDFEVFLAEAYFFYRIPYLRPNLDNLELPAEVKEFVNLVGEWPEVDGSDGEC